MSKLELQLAAQIADSDLPAPEREYRFAAVVVGLGPGIRARLVRNDCAKYNAAALLGWRVLRFTASMLNDDFAIVMLKQAMGTKGERI